ncbi:hypothetical protein G5V59_24475 [Nocardioides sp. W3-2-3]|nr:hypothetical protein [Nocardioides convexus]
MRGLDSLTAGLAQDRDRISTSLEGIARLSATAAGVVEEAGGPLVDVASLSRPWIAYLASRRDLLARTGAAVPQRTRDLPAHAGVRQATSTSTSAPSPRG